MLEGAGGAIYYIENAVAMLNKQYFHYGVKRAYEEPSVMENRPEKLCDMIDDIISAKSITDVQKYLTALMKATRAVFGKVKATFTVRKKTPDEETISGTYEEMYSNWRNKMHAAAKAGNRHLAFMSLISANAMFSEIDSEVDIDRYNVLEGFDAQDLHRTAEAYDNIINDYLKEYRKAGIEVKHYSDVDAFAREYHTKDI